MSETYSLDLLAYLSQPIRHPEGKHLQQRCEECNDITLWFEFASDKHQQCIEHHPLLYVEGRRYIRY
jgi:hypothetical protein